MLDTICQFGIIIFGLLSIFLIARKNRWGFVFGLLAQPFWFITTYTNQQWGIFLLAAAYTVTWAYGIWEWFFKKEKPQPTPPKPPVTREISRFTRQLYQNMLDAKQTVVLFNGFTPKEVWQLLDALENMYKAVGGQELQLHFVEGGILAKPYDDPPE